MTQDSLILRTDSYKLSHWMQFPPKTQRVHSYFASRGGEHSALVFYSLQYFLKAYLTGQVISASNIAEASAFVDAHMGPGLFNRAGWKHILADHHGRLPVSIRAVPEGTLCEPHNVLMTVENTCPKCFWLPNYLETLLVKVWYATTVATNSFWCKHLIREFLEETGSLEGLDFRLHDFGYRGVSSEETAALGGSAHLVNFLGTDTIAGIRLTQKYYGAGMTGFSVPAAEHSTITSWGKEHEAEALRNMLEKYPTGVVACVSDSYDIMNAVKEIWGKELLPLVNARDGIVVVRPDSGDPVEIVPQVIEGLMEAYGSRTNAKGFKVLPDKIRVIQGDGIDLRMIERIYRVLRKKKLSGDNLTFGSGGGLLQKFDRDTLQFAFKCSAIEVDGQWRDVYKDPLTMKSKASQRGRLKLVRTCPGGSTFRTARLEDEGEDVLVEVFRDGNLLVDQSFGDIRKRASVPEKEAVV